MCATRKSASCFRTAAASSCPWWCNDCQEGRLASDPYHRAGNHDDYDNYGDYESGWGSDDFADFTEADGEALERENEDFEKDLGES